MSVTEFKFERNIIRVEMYDGTMVDVRKPNMIEAEWLEDNISIITNETKDDYTLQLTKLSKLTKEFVCKLGMTIEQCNQLEPAHLKMIVDHLVFEKKS